VSKHQQVLLTGATGHVGGRLFRHLATKAGFSIRALVRSPRLLPEWAQHSEVLEGDLSQSVTRRQALSGIDTVVHLATHGFSAANGPAQADLDNEQRIARALASEAVSAGVSRFIFVSSIHVYGASLTGVVDESTAAVPTTAYGASRLEIENELLELASNTSMQSLVLRLTNSFGSPALMRPDTWSLLIHDLCKQVVETSRISLRSDARTCRDMIALRDVVSVMSELITTNRINTGVVLLATGRSMQIGEIAGLVQTLAREVVGIDAPIDQGASLDVVPPMFTLEPRKLRAAGVVIPHSRDAEIRDLLLLAQQEFGNTNS